MFGPNLVRKGARHTEGGMEHLAEKTARAEDLKWDPTWLVHGTQHRLDGFQDEGAEGSCGQRQPCFAVPGAYSCPFLTGPAGQAPVQPVSTVAWSQPARQVLGAMLTLAPPHPLPGTWQASRPAAHLASSLPLPLSLGRV